MILLILAAFVLGLGVSALWFSRRGDSSAPTKQVDELVPQLSESTKAMLRALEGPVEIRFYSLLGREGVADSFHEFSGRIKQLLVQYEGESKGRIKVTCVESNLASTAKAAFADGITPLNIEPGDPCFLGLTVARADQKEILAQLSPEWEQALESDLTRAILRVSGAKLLARPSGASSPSEAAATEEVKRFIPDPATVTLEEGTRILRQQGVKEFQLSNEEMARQIKELQYQISQLSGVEQQTAIQQLQQAQSAQVAKLKQIAAQADLRIAAWERLKRGSP